MCYTDAQKRSSTAREKMRKGSTQQTPQNTEEPTPQAQPEMNPKMWIQLSIDQHQQTSRLLEEQQHHTNILLSTMQKMQEEMVHVISDNERLMQEQERIIKSFPTGKSRGITT